MQLCKTSPATCAHRHNAAAALRLPHRASIAPPARRWQAHAEPAGKHPDTPSLPSIPITVIGDQSVSNPVSRQGINLGSVTTALWHAAKAWDTHDGDKSGGLTVSEVKGLLNSHELQDAALLLTNIAPTVWTEEQLKPHFQKADLDKSGCLSRTEFLALYLFLCTERVIDNPLVLAEALLGFIDVDRDGVIQGKELKVLLTMLGFPFALLAPIPPNVGLQYRQILQQMSGFMKGMKKPSKK